MKTLTSGLNELGTDAIAALGRLVPNGTYRVLLLQILPALVMPGTDADYFAHEQVENEGGVDPFWGLPHHPKVPYYRCGAQVLDTSGDRQSDEKSKLFEFVAPLAPEAWLSRTRLAFYETVLATGTIPTAFALSVLDAKGPAMQGVDHLCLTHYLLDGHHKLAAAARTAKPITLVSFVSMDQSRATEADVATVVENLDWI